MAVRAPTFTPDDQEYYPLHEEDDVPEIPPHEATVRDLRGVFTVRFPGWLVTGNVCIYWERGNTKKYRAPDALLVKEPLALDFGLDEAGEMRVYTPGGEVLLTHAETEAARQREAAARQTAAAGRRAAEAARQAAEAARAEEAAAR